MNNDTRLAYQNNSLGQPVGLTTDFSSATLPRHETISGRYCRLEPLNADQHAEQLFDANSTDSQGRNWTYLPYGPFSSLSDYRGWLEPACENQDPQFYAVVHSQSELALGVASYLRISPESGTIEVGHIHFGECLKRTTLATEAMFLMMRRAFELGYRRYEWKCDALNSASRKAAERLGFVFEGIFRQATVYKGRNRDTAWYSVIDRDWPRLSTAFEDWLSPANFDDQGRQRVTLGSLMSISDR